MSYRGSKTTEQFADLLTEPGSLDRTDGGPVQGDVNVPYFLTDLLTGHGRVEDGIQVRWLKKRQPVPNLFGGTAQDRVAGRRR